MGALQTGKPAVVTGVGALILGVWPSLVFTGDGTWRSGGPYGARIRGAVYSLAIDPATPSTLHAGGDGVFTSTDAGTRWFKNSTGLPSGSVSTVAVDPAAPRTLYAGTWWTGRATVVSRSFDAGVTWAPVLTLGNDVLVTAFAFDSASHSVYVGARQAGVGSSNGVHKSTDGGATWVTANNGLPNRNVAALVVDPAAPSTLYAGTLGNGLFKSTDAGASWVAASAGLIHLDVSALVIDASAPETLYAGTWGGGVFKTTDAGGVWAAVGQGLPSDSMVAALAIDPGSPATLYAGESRGVFKSTNGGGTWTAISSGLPATWVSSLAINPRDTHVLFVGAREGAYASADGGATWRELVLPPPEAARIVALAVSPDVRDMAYAAAWEDTAVFKTTDGGTSWAAADSGLPSPVSLRDIAVDPTNSAILYAGGTDGVFRSTDSARSWTFASRAGVHTLAVDPAHPSTLYGATSEGVFKSLDSGTTWTALTTGVYNVLSVAVDPVSPTTLYAGSSGFGTLKSTDAGATWVTLAGLAGLDVVRITVDPRTPTTVYATIAQNSSRSLYRSSDGGGTWGPFFADGSLIAVDPATPQKLYVAASSGVFKSTDAGVTWVGVNQGLTSSMTSALVLDPTGTTLYAGFSDGGVWQLRGTTGEFYTIDPCRAVDTRAADGPRVDAGTTRTFTLIGRCGIPADADAVSFNVTATETTSPGHLQVHPANALLRPSASALNFAAGQTRASNAVTILGVAGDLAVTSGQANGSMHVIIDVNGYFK